MKKYVFILVLVVVAVAIMCEAASAQQRWPILTGRIKNVGVTTVQRGNDFVQFHILEDVKENVVCYIMYISDRFGSSHDSGISCVPKKAE